MSYVDFFGGSYFLSWCSLWLVWGVLPISVAILNFTLKAYSRGLRSINVLLRGWPPAHLDADGDFCAKAEQ